ncbi:MAG: CvpA family protein, partial [Oscillospiraceae bacterium]|nr:CvpA family protein [Oscillospiraceae bacterium]
MIRLIIDIILLVIVGLCTWGGYRRGLIGGVAGILAIVIALFGGSLLSSAYSHEVVPALQPFVDGFISSQKT